MLRVKCVGDVIVLIKPQFEAGREEARRGKGIIRDPEVHVPVYSMRSCPLLMTTGYGMRGSASITVGRCKGQPGIFILVKLACRCTFS
jgi:23S rRNA (cytidine1920-2'-O)/16S rRNA (cytidine1409-2'-O)-methyltransferase